MVLVTRTDIKVLLLWDVEVLKNKVFIKAKKCMVTEDMN
jgi:hypothetical protein